MPIMIVDDDAEYLSYMAMTLQAAGIDPELAQSSEEASQKIQERRFSLIVTDLVMPGKTGLQLIEEARRKDPLTVGIIMTAFGSVESAMEALRQGVYDYLFKPSTQDVIQASVRRGLEHYAMRRTLIRQAGQIEQLQQQYLGTAGLVDEVTHALRNPLTSVYGFSTYLFKKGLEKCSPDEFNRGLESISRNVEKMTQLLERLDAGKPV